jgi:hypothetical protein
MLAAEEAPISMTPSSESDSGKDSPGTKSSRQDVGKSQECKVFSDII